MELVIGVVPVTYFTPLVFGVVLDRSHIAPPMRHKGLVEDYTENSMGHDLGS